MGSQPGKPGPVRRGAAPLPQARVLAPLLRDITGLALALEAEAPAVDELIGHLAAAKTILRDLVPADLTPRMLAADGQKHAGEEHGGRVYLDHSHDIGDYNPFFPQYEITVDGDHAAGTVEFPLALEGPPGKVHGGALSLFFDAIIQQHNCEIGLAGKTAFLHVDFLRPTPLLRSLPFEVERTGEGERSRSWARLGDEGRPYCTATVEAVAGDVSRLRPVSPRKTGRT